jgi:hypothetical protein
MDADTLNRELEPILMAYRLSGYTFDADSSPGTVNLHLGLSTNGKVWNALLVMLRSDGSYLVWGKEEKMVPEKDLISAIVDALEGYRE